MDILKRIILCKKPKPEHWFAYFKKPKPEHWFAYFLIAGFSFVCVMILQVLGS
jgi:hypothetical protein